MDRAVLEAANGGNSAGKNLVEAGADQSRIGPREHTELGPRTGLMPDDTVGEPSQIMPGNGAMETFQWSPKSAIPVIKL
jgi:hypothetical protein